MCIRDSNEAFCYKEMEWTTGSASQGVGGFGGIPSTVGANEGNGTDFIQFTRNDHEGVDYDGPFGVPDGVSWLDFKSFRFTTAVTTQNIPPIVNSNFLCDTVEVCMGELVDFDYRGRGYHLRLGGLLPFLCQQSAHNKHDRTHNYLSVTAFPFS